MIDPTGTTAAILVLAAIYIIVISWLRYIDKPKDEGPKYILAPDAYGTYTLKKKSLIIGGYLPIEAGVTHSEADQIIRKLENSPSN